MRGECLGDRKATVISATFTTSLSEIDWSSTKLVIRSAEFEQQRTSHQIISGKFGSCLLKVPNKRSADTDLEINYLMVAHLRLRVADISTRGRTER